MKNWIIKKPVASSAQKISECGVSKLCSDVLTCRGIITPEQAEIFLNPIPLSDPFILQDMREAADIINNAVDENKSICIYGDYDCDGITATAMLYSYLECMGADVRFYIPERDEGYGMNIPSIKKLAEEGTELIITVDNGISAIEEAEIIAELGMELVITDHHRTADVLPKAAAIVNPHRRECPSVFKELCGAGIALKLIAALDGGDYDAIFEQFGDLAAIGTVADIVNLSGENRYIVSNGLSLLENSENLGINALIEECGLTGKKITATSVGYVLAPRINAAGRFGSPLTALKLFLSDDEDEAKALAAKLSALNNQRKKCENEILCEIEKQIEDNPRLLNERILCFWGKDWYHGVIGIICAKMVERYQKPCYIITAEGENARGSARSFEGYSIHQSLSECSGLLTNFGGHPGAGGFSLKTKDIPNFIDNLKNYADSFEAMPLMNITAEKILTRDDFILENVMGLNVLEPFGEGNREPLFAVLGAQVTAVYAIGNGKHTRIKLNYDSISLYAVIFGASPDETGLKQGLKADFIVSLETDSYNNKNGVSVRIRDYRLCGINQNKYFSARSAYDSYMTGKKLPVPYYARIIPSRSELETVYKTAAKEKCSFDNLLAVICSDGTDMNYCKLRLCLDIFDELGLVKTDTVRERYSIIPVRKKVDLESSEILRLLRQHSAEKCMAVQ